MGIINTQVKVTDGMSKVLRNMNKALNIVLNSFESLQDVSSNAIDSGSIEEARAELQKAAAAAYELENGMTGVCDEVGRANDGFTVMKGIVSNVAANAVSRIASGIKETVSAAIDYASDLAEVQNVVDVTFGASANIIDEWSKGTLDSFGLNELSAKRYASTMGAMLKSSGMSGDSIVEMSQNLAQLSGDMASFHNLNPEEAFAKIRSGIAGETEPLSQLGIKMTVANLEAYAMAQGIEKAYSEMSQGEQVALRYSYLLSAASDSLGDYSRTAGSFANQQKSLNERWKEATGAIAERFIPSLTNALTWLNQMIPVVSGVIDSIANIGYAIFDFVEPAIPVVAAFAGAWLAYKVGVGLAAGAQKLFNAALKASPITWIIGAIVVFISLIYIVVDQVNKATGLATSATGIIAGSVSWLCSFVVNTVIGLLNGLLELIWTFVSPCLSILEWLINAINGGFNGLGGAVANLIGQMISWLLSLAKVVSKIIDAIFGTDWTKGLDNLKNEVESWGKNDNAITINKEAPTIDYRIDMTDAFDAGYDFGKDIEDKIGNVFNLGDLNYDPADYGISNYDDLISGVSGIYDNTDNISKSLDITEEDLKYLRDIAEQEAINRFTTAEIKIDMQNHNSISSDMDIDGIVTQLEDKLYESMTIAAEGV